MTEAERIEIALQIAQSHGFTDGAHHKAWVIDQMVRALTACPMTLKSAVDVHGTPYEYSTRGESPEYLKFVADHNYGDDGPDTYEWDEGIAP